VLGAAALDVDTTTTAEQALGRAAIRLPDAAIVAPELHDRDGVEVCRQFAPVECHAAAHPGRDRRRGRDGSHAEAGADDYMTGRPARALLAEHQKRALSRRHQWQLAQ
jgi:DNA-binding response OmpR family regulator